MCKKLCKLFCSVNFNQHDENDYVFWPIINDKDAIFQKSFKFEKTKVLELNWGQDAIHPFLWQISESLKE